MVHTAPGEPGNLISPLEDPGSLPWMLYDPPWKTREFVELNYQLYFIRGLPFNIQGGGGGRDIGMDQNIFFNMIQLMVIFFQLYG